MVDPYVLYRLYLQQFSMLKTRKGFEITPVNFKYQDIIIVATGLIEHDGKNYVFQTNSCGCGPQPTIRGAYFAEIIPWLKSDLYSWFAASNTKDSKLANQKVIKEVYRVRLPENQREKEEVAAALRSHFGQAVEVNFF